MLPPATGDRMMDDRATRPSPGLSATEIHESRGQGMSAHIFMITLFGIGRRDIPGNTWQPKIAELVGPFHGGEFTPRLRTPSADAFSGKS